MKSFTVINYNTFELCVVSKHTDSPHFMQLKIGNKQIYYTERSSQSLYFCSFCGLSNSNQDCTFLRKIQSRKLITVIFASVYTMTGERHCWVDWHPQQEDHWVGLKTRYEATCCRTNQVRIDLQTTIGDAFPNISSLTDKADKYQDPLLEHH